jgi:hypothetical protein
MNNTIILNHHGLSIYIDIGYLNSYYDLNISHMEMNILEYLLKDLSYVSEEMFIMSMIRQ